MFPFLANFFILPTRLICFRYKTITQINPYGSFYFIIYYIPQIMVSDSDCLQIMVQQQRRDLLMNIPALKKLDAMLIVMIPI